jgi:hypothetical protein
MSDATPDATTRVPRTPRKLISAARNGALQALQEIRLLQHAVQHAVAGHPTAYLLADLVRFTFRCFFRNALNSWHWAGDGVESLLTRVRPQGPWTNAMGKWANAHEGVCALVIRLHHAPMDVQPELSSLFYSIADTLPRPAESWTNRVLSPLPLAVITLMSLQRLATLYVGACDAIAGLTEDVAASTVASLRETADGAKAEGLKMLQGRGADPEFAKTFSRLEASRDLRERLLAADAWDWAAMAARLTAELRGFDHEAWVAEVKWESAQATTLAGTPAKPRKRRRTPERGPRPLTPAQAEAVHLVGEHKGNVTAAAKAAGKSRQVMKRQYEAAMKKLAKTGVKNPHTVPLPHDRRGQADVVQDARRV